MTSHRGRLSEPRSRTGNYGGYGWMKDIPDHRDQMMYGDVIHVDIMPDHIDLTPLCPPVVDQGQLGSCTANAIAGAVEFDLMKQKLPVFPPSRLFIYFNERQMEGTVQYDSGAMIRDGIKSVNQVGACSEIDWPYDISKFRTQPSPLCYADALRHQALSYSRVPSNRTSLLRLCLSNGIPFVFGFTVYQSFESEGVAHTGMVPMPQKGETILGGHAVLAVGYDDKTKLFKVRNSWGTNWGDHGYFYMPYEYLTNPNLADDFWCIKVMEGPTPTP